MVAVPRADSRAALLAQLGAITPKPAIFADEESLRPFETDAFISHREVPLAAVLPENEEQVRKVIGVCRAAGVAVVTRGAGTGISGGAIPNRDGILLVMSKMRGVLARRSRWRAARRWNRACATCRSPIAPRRTAFTTLPIRQASRSARSAATWPRIPAASIASSTGSPRTTCTRFARSMPRATCSNSAGLRSTVPATTCSHSSPAARATSAWSRA